MKIKSRLYNTIVGILSQHRKWLDIRHMFTLAWIVVGLIKSEKVSLTAWIPHVESRAQYAQSTQRRFQRWFYNDRIHQSLQSINTGSKNGAITPCIWL